MSTATWDLIWRIVESAQDVPTAERDVHVEEACGRNLALLREVRSLLGHTVRKDDFLATPAPLGADDPPSETATVGRPGQDGEAHEIGRVIAGRYGLDGFLGRGGFGAVYTGVDQLNFRPVAVKLLRAGTRQSVRREVATLRQLRIPGVVQLLEDGVDEGDPYIVMELVAGEHFPGEARNQPWPWEELRDRAIGLLEALARVHQQGILHRDLKPHNVLVDSSGRCTILDLGIALEGSFDPDDEARAGTPPFIAPEILRGEPADARSDLFSVGVMLWHALCGKPIVSLTGGPHETILRQLEQDPTPVADSSPATPAAVSALIDSLVAKDPRTRPASAAAAAAILRGVDPTAFGVELPLTGRERVLEELIQSMRRGESRRLCGPTGSGRTRILAEVAAKLRGEGIRVLLLSPAGTPLGSLTPLVQPSSCASAESVEDLSRIIEQQIGTMLQQGAVILADDLEHFDRWSAAVLEHLGAHAAIIGTSAHARDGEPTLEPLTPEQMECFFAGPERLLHLQSRAAGELHRRTQGWPALVTQELAGWERAGLTWRQGDVFHISRRSLDRLCACGGIVVSTDVDRVPDELSRELRAVLRVTGLAVPHATREIVAGALERPAWAIDAYLKELGTLGLLEFVDGERLLPRVNTDSIITWTPEEQRGLHETLARVLPVDSPARLLHMLAADLPEDITPLAVELSGNMIREGSPGEALGLLRSVLTTLRGRAGGTDSELAILREMLQAALFIGSSPAVDECLLEIGRSAYTPEIAQLGELARSALYTLQRDPRALAMLDRVGPESLGAQTKRLWQAVRLQASKFQGIEEHERVVSEIVGWAASEGAEATQALAASALGWLRYSQLRFEEAGEQHLRAMEHARGTLPRVRSALNAAQALLEVWQLDRVRSLVDEQLEHLERHPHPSLEAMVALLGRSASYRAGEPLDADLDLIEALRSLGDPGLRAQAGINEAAIAWRSGRGGLAAEIAMEAAELYGAGGASSTWVLSRSLAHLCGSTLPASDLEAFAERATTLREPGLAVQACGLLAMAEPVLMTRFGAASRARAEELPRGTRPCRREILSVDEALNALPTA